VVQRKGHQIHAGADAKQDRIAGGDVPLLLEMIVGNLPLKAGKRMPPAEPAMPPMPITEATAFLGNMSDTVYRDSPTRPECATRQTISKTAVQSPTFVP